MKTKKQNSVLVLDIGNSSVDAALFQHGLPEKRKKTFWRTDHFSKRFRDWLLVSGAADCGFFIAGSVNRQARRRVALILKSIPELRGLFLDHRIKKRYAGYLRRNPALGWDRLANLVAAERLFPGSACLVVDAGTAVTLDAISGRGRYLGGAIFSSPDAALRGLAQCAPALPLIRSRKKVRFPAYSTRDCLNTGAVLGVVAQIASLIERYNQKYKMKFRVILCGGGADWLWKNLSCIDCKDPDLTLKGYFFMGTAAHGGAFLKQR